MADINKSKERSEDIKDLMKKYKKRLSSELNISPDTLDYKKPVYSREYKQFKSEYLPKRMSLYEKACNFSEKILKLNPDKKKIPDMLEDIRVSHMNITPSGILSLSILVPISIIFAGGFLGYILPLLFGVSTFFFVGVAFLIGMLSFVVLNKLPSFFANSWRMKASNQMVLCIFYIVTFMRHTSNLELAIQFAADHLGPPLSLDLKKVLWDVETAKYESIKESLDAYLETWKKWNKEFIESFHLIESSLYEPSEGRRLELLDKSLDIILSETYEKMLHYAHNLKSPITMIHMMGVILPILGLVMLPLAINFMSDEFGIPLVKWYHISVLYNLLIPIAVFLLGKSVLSKRPTGYGSSNITENNPGMKKYENLIINVFGSEVSIDPKILCIFIGIILFFIGISPILMHWAGTPDIGINLMGEDLSTSCERQFCMLEYKEVITSTQTLTFGPYGLGATILSLALVLSISLPLGLYYSIRSKNLMKIRERSKDLEEEFASALFQLGNRLGDGLPTEIAFEKVAMVMQDSMSGNFFNIVSSNIRRLGMSVQEAIFNPRSGALVSFPSNLIESSMKVLIQSSRKGPKVAAQALTNVSRYIKEIHSVNERLQDLMGDIISSMKSQISFLTPVIAGIVIGITSMISNIMSKLAASQKQFSSDLGANQSGLANLLSGIGIPTYYFQIIIGLYVIQIVYVLSILANGIENGEDKLAERSNLGKNLLRSVTLYTIISFAIILLFNIVASTIIGSVGGL